MEENKSTIKLYKNIFELHEFVTLIQKLAQINKNEMHT